MGYNVIALLCIVILALCPLHHAPASVRRTKVYNNYWLI